MKVLISPVNPCGLILAGLFLLLAGDPTLNAQDSIPSALADKAWILLKNKKISSADSLISKAFDLAKSSGAEIPPELSRVRAELALMLKDVEEAGTYADKALSAAEEKGNRQLMGELYILKARILYFSGDFLKSLDELDKNIRFAGEHRLKTIRPSSCFAKADIFEAVKDYAKAVAALEEMLVYAREEGDLSETELAYSRLGRARLTYMRDFSLADQYYRQSLDLSKQLGDSLRTAYAMTNLGWNFYLDKQLDSSLFYYRESLKYSQPINRPSIIANSYGNIGTIFRDLGEYDKAIQAWEKGIDHAGKINDWYTLSWIFEDMSKMAVSTGNYRDAYNYYVKHKTFSDSLGNQNFSEGQVMARVKFDTETKKKELQLLSLRLRNQRLLLYAIAGILLLSVAVGLLLLRQSRLNARRKIAEMDQKILEVTQANLRQQMNPHFIFNTLNSIQYYMYKHDKLATNNYLTKFSNLMRKILENSRHTAVPIRDELDALQLYLELESIRFRDKFDYRIILDEEVDPLMYKIPTMLIQPYVENSICHGLMLKPDKGMVTVSISLARDYLCCVIEDNGIGRDASREINRNKQHNHQSLGTQITESRLQLVNSLYGTSLTTTFTDLKDEAGLPAGTRVEIHIPILT